MTTNSKYMSKREILRVTDFSGFGRLVAKANENLELGLELTTESISVRDPRGNWHIQKLPARGKMVPFLTFFIEEAIQSYLTGLLPGSTSVGDLIVLPSEQTAGRTCQLGVFCADLKDIQYSLYALVLPSDSFLKDPCPTNFCKRFSFYGWPSEEQIKDTYERFAVDFRRTTELRTLLRDRGIEYVITQDGQDVGRIPPVYGLRTRILDGRPQIAFREMTSVSVNDADQLAQNITTTVKLMHTVCPRHIENQVDEPNVLETDLDLC